MRFGRDFQRSSAKFPNLIFWNNVQDTVLKIRYENYVYCIFVESFNADAKLHMQTLRVSCINEGIYVSGFRRKFKQHSICGVQYRTLSSMINTYFIFKKSLFTRSCRGEVDLTWNKSDLSPPRCHNLSKAKENHKYKVNNIVIECQFEVSVCKVELFRFRNCGSCYPRTNYWNNPRIYFWYRSFRLLYLLWWCISCVQLRCRIYSES